MNVSVEGVSIELTAEQMAKIEKVRKARARCNNSFVRMLKHFGFKQIDTSDWPTPTDIAFEQKEHNWFAQILNNATWSEVWLVGPGLKCNGFPGGHYYGSPEEIKKEITAALDKQSPNGESQKP